MHKIYYVFLFLFNISVFAQNDTLKVKYLIITGEFDKETGKHVFRIPLSSQKTNPLI